MTNSVEVCPACRLSSPHHLPMYPTVPRQLTTDGAAVTLFIGLCPKVGLFILYTTNGWYIVNDKHRAAA